MPAKVHTQTTDSPIARLTAFIHWTTDNVITEQGWRKSESGKAIRAQRSYLPEEAKGEEGTQASGRLIVSLSHPVRTEQESTGSSGTLESLLCDPTAIRDIESNTERSLLAQRLEQVLNEALAKAGLTDQQRIIIRLDAHRVSEGYPLADKEIAEMLKTDPDTVKTQRSKGRQALAEYLESQSAQDPSLKELIMEILSKRRSKRPKAPGGS